MADFEGHFNEFTEQQTKIIAASVDDKAEASKTIAELKLSYPVGYGLNARDISAQTGAFFSAAKEYLHATGFIIGADGKVAEAVYSTGPIGRLMPTDCLQIIAHLAKNKA